MKDWILGIRKFFESIRGRSSFVYVAMGDSTAEGVGATKPEHSFASLVYQALKTEYKHVQHYNLGQSGSMVGDVIANQLNHAISLKPDLVTLSVGANDIRARTKADAFERELGLLIKRLREETGAKIMVNNIPDLAHIPAIPFFLRLYGRILVKRLNRIILETAEDYQVVLVDLYKHTNVFTKKFPQLISADGLHPSDFGHALWASAVISSLSKG